MRNLQEYGLWLVLVIICAFIVSQWMNFLILMSDEPAGLAAGLFLSIFLASLIFLLIRTGMSWLGGRQYEARLQAARALKSVAIV